MSINEILRIVRSYIEQSRLNQSVENDKFDFKREWYNLTEEAEVNEFLKDTTAIANTFGPDGFIVIGFDERENSLHEARFTDSGLNDKEKLYGLINKRVDRLFDLKCFDTIIEGTPISILHIPPSLDKPHVIRNYVKFDRQGNRKETHHRIFVRKSTTVRPATKYDLELMFYDRKNLIPDYSLIFYVKGLTLINQENARDFQGSFIIENIGKRPVAIKHVKFLIRFDSYGEEWFELSSNYVLKTNPSAYSGQFSNLVAEPIFVYSGEMTKSVVYFEFLAINRENKNDIVEIGEIIEYKCIVTTTTEKELEVNLYDSHLY